MPKCLVKMVEMKFDVIAAVLMFKAERRNLHKINKNDMKMNYGLVMQRSTNKFTLSSFMQLTNEVFLIVHCRKKGVFSVGYLALVVSLSTKCKKIIFSFQIFF